MLMKGKVIKGGGQSVKRMEMNDTLKVLQDSTGMKIIPGTLNIELDREIFLKKGKQFEDILVTGEKYPFVLYPCEINNYRAFIVRMPLGYRKGKCIEIISDVHLRTKFNLNDDDKVDINI